MKYSQLAFSERFYWLSQELQVEQFKAKILRTLKDNGFPEKRVSLPTDKLFQMADDLGFSFKTVLDQFATIGIEGTIGADKTVFRAIPEQKDTPSSEQIMAKAQEMMAQMTPEQRDELMRQYQAMSEDQKQSILEQGKKMGLF